jgi:hypothetical protein
VRDAALQDALAPVLVDPLIGQGRVGEDPVVQVLDRHGSAGHRPDGVGERVQLLACPTMGRQIRQLHPAILGEIANDWT